MRPRLWRSRQQLPPINAEAPHGAPSRPPGRRDTDLAVNSTLAAARVDDFAASRNPGSAGCRRCWPVEATSSPKWSRENSRLRRRAHPARTPARGVHRDPHVHRSRFPGELVPPPRAVDVVVGAGTDQGVGVVLTGDHASAASVRASLRHHRWLGPPPAGMALLALDKRDTGPYDRASCWARGAGDRQVRSRESGGHA